MTVHFTEEAYASVTLISAGVVTDLVVQNRTCLEHIDAKNLPPTCITKRCGQIIQDGLFSDDDVSSLRAIAEKGMSNRVATGGPTILDINTGYIRDTNGLQNLFENASISGEFTEDEFTKYGRIINKLKETLQKSFGIESLYFTAPTFITRLDGRADWSPQEIHDEYWHPHIDR
jgi:hypothetical protein